MKCPICDGRGYWREPDIYEDCSYCKSTGKVSLRKALSYIFWTHVSLWFIEWYGEFIAPRRQ